MLTLRSVHAWTFLLLFQRAILAGKTNLDSTISPSSLLLIHGNPETRHRTAAFLGERCFRTVCLQSGRRALSQMREERYDLVLTDLDVPDMDGLEFLSLIRSRYPKVPVVVLTTQGSLDTAVRCIQLGVKDYLIQPISKQHFLERLNAVLCETASREKRIEIVNQVQDLLEKLGQLEIKPRVEDSGISGSRIIACGPFRLDLVSRQVWKNGHLLDIAPGSFSYLATLAQFSPQPVAYEALVDRARGDAPDQCKSRRDLARWHIHGLRKAIHDDVGRPRHIITVRGVGYCLVP